mmetsp:Transcript_25255/g.47065  ORF Transcript_25255/g.47065 Transcript_25255/m.47065 type:complete len:225 (+) Transcript_25255:180-854(+)
MVFTHASIGNLLCKTSGNEFVLGIDTQKVETRERSKLLGTCYDFLLQILSAGFAILGVLVSFGVKLFSHGDAKGHVGASVRNQHDYHFPDISTLLSVDTSQHGSCKCVGQGRSTTAWHLLQTLSSHGDRFCGREKDIRHFTLERNEGNLVATLVGFSQKTDSSTLCCVHAVESHRSGGVDDENDQRTGFSCHFLDSDIRILNVDTTTFVLSSNGTFTSGLLVRS